jgi:hypothetical protein
VQHHAFCVAGCTTTVGLVSKVDVHEIKFWPRQIRLFAIVNLLHVIITYFSRKPLTYVGLLEKF